MAREEQRDAGEDQRALDGLDAPAREVVVDLAVVGEGVADHRHAERRAGHDEEQRSDDEEEAAAALVRVAAIGTGRLGHAHSLLGGSIHGAGHPKRGGAVGASPRRATRRNFPSGSIRRSRPGTFRPDRARDRGPDAITARAIPTGAAGAPPGLSPAVCARQDGRLSPTSARTAAASSGEEGDGPFARRGSVARLRRSAVPVAGPARLNGSTTGKRRARAPSRRSARSRLPAERQRADLPEDARRDVADAEGMKRLANFVLVWRARRTRAVEKEIDGSASGPARATPASSAPSTSRRGDAAREASTRRRRRDRPAVRRVRRTGALLVKHAYAMKRRLPRSPERRARRGGGRPCRRRRTARPRC